MARHYSSHKRRELLPPAPMASDAHLFVPGGAVEEMHADIAARFAAGAAVLPLDADSQLERFVSGFSRAMGPATLFAAIAVIAGVLLHL